MDQRPSPSDFPLELGGLILRLLPCHMDRLSFRSACRQWRLAERQHRPHLPPPGLPLMIWLGEHNFLSFAGGELRRFRTDHVDVLRHRFPSCRGSFDGWLLFQRYGEYSMCFLINPLSGANIKIPLLLDNGARFDRFPMQKIIVCSPNLIAAILWDSSVGFYRPGASSWSACPTDYWGRGSYVDIALYRGKIYALNTKDGLFIHEVGDAAASGIPKASHVVDNAIVSQPLEIANPEGIVTRRYLVISCIGKLLLVKLMVPFRLPRSGSSSSKATDGIMLKVFEADLEMGRWMEVNNLDSGEALFVGGGCSRAVRLTGSDKRFQENCVYILGHVFLDMYCCDAMPTYGSYDLKNGTIRQVVLDRMRVVWPVLSMEWFFPQE
ncbi:unnamed protein product [Urochloa humidicola]